MTGTRRKFSEDFKREAVALSYSSGKTIDEVACFRKFLEVAPPNYSAKIIQVRGVLNNLERAL